MELIWLLSRLILLRLYQYVLDITLWNLLMRDILAIHAVVHLGHQSLLLVLILRLIHDLARLLLICPILVSIAIISSLFLPLLRLSFLAPFELTPASFAEKRLVVLLY